MRVTSERPLMMLISKEAEVSGRRHYSCWDLLAILGR